LNLWSTESKIPEARVSTLSFSMVSKVNMLLDLESNKKYLMSKLLVYLKDFLL
jgi:hypothetical protein